MRHELWLHLKSNHWLVHEEKELTKEVLEELMSLFEKYQRLLLKYYPDTDTNYNLESLITPENASFLEDYLTHASYCLKRNKELSTSKVIEVFPDYRDKNNVEKVRDRIERFIALLSIIVPNEYSIEMIETEKEKIKTIHCIVEDRIGNTVEDRIGRECVVQYREIGLSIEMKTKIMRK